MERYDAGRVPVYIAGVAETAPGKVADQSEFSMAALASIAALGEAGLGPGNVDGLFTNYMGEQIVSMPDGRIVYGCAHASTRPTMARLPPCPNGGTGRRAWRPPPMACR